MAFLFLKNNETLFGYISYINVSLADIKTTENMKHFIESHETIIEFDYIPAHKANVGELIQHNKYIQGVYFYKKTWIDGQEVHLKIELNKAFIIDIFNQIQVLESQSIELPYEEIPF